MTALTWFLRFIIFAFLVLFAVQNTAPVTLSLALDYYWQAPLVIVLLAFFGGGALLGVLSLVGTIFRQRREIARLKRALLKAEQPPLPDLSLQQ
jgi:putative membrane protein